MGIYSKRSTTMFPFFHKNLPNFFPDRLKRSLFLKKPHVKVTVKTQNGSEIIKELKGHNLRVRRFENGSVVPSGFLFEKKKLFIQYMPVEKKIFPKCSHVPKESKSHEHELKHPFYKNTQRLDEMLDQFLDKSFPDLLGYDPKGQKKTCHHEPIQKKKPVQFMIDSTERVYNKLVKSNVNRAKKIKNEFMKILKTESTLAAEKGITSHHPLHSSRSPHFHSSHASHAMKDEEERVFPYVVPTENYDLVLSISTLM